MYDLGPRIKAIREKRGLTQKGLAHKINKSPSAVSSYELGRQVPPFDVVITICQALNVSLNYLAGVESDTEYILYGLNKEQTDLVISLIDALQNTNYSDGLTTQHATLLGNIAYALIRRRQE